VAVADILRTIRDLDYEPKVVDKPATQVVLADRIDPASLPAELSSLFAAAKAANKPVLLEFSGPG
jgi:hypothetical protein